MLRISKIAATAVIALAMVVLQGCGRGEPLSRRMVRSEMQRCPTAADLDGMNGRLKWNYTTGLELLAFLDAADNYGFGNKATARGKGPCRVPRGEPGPGIAFSQSLGIAPPKADAKCCRCPEITDTCVKNPIKTLQVSRKHGHLQHQAAVLEYVDAWYDAIIRDDGSIGANYRKSAYSLDHICPARTLFNLYELTGKHKYRAAMDSIYSQIRTQPRTEAGAFWHKQIYPHQVWLDGFYMVQPFFAEYSARFLDSAEAKRNYADIAAQFQSAFDKCYDPSTRLLRHAWDESRTMFWADPQTGQSAHAWGRALGWYMMALVDVLDWIPEDHPASKDLKTILCTLLDTLQDYDDPATGMWYQVLDCPGRERNYIESTCSAMFTYAYLKAAGKGYAPQYARYARKLYRKLVKAFIRKNPDGTITLTQCCAVAGLGGKQNRSGDYDYYIHETITENDPKGIGPFIWASLYYENAK